MTDRSDLGRFAVYLPAADTGDDHVIVAVNLRGPDAIRTEIEVGGSWRVHDREDEHETLRLYHLRPYARESPYQDGLDALYATVAKTADTVRDRAPGMSVIVDQFLRKGDTSSKARLETDEEFDKRLLHAAKRREVHRLDKEIATRLFDAPLTDGYVVTDASGEEFERYADREAILRHPCH